MSRKEILALVVVTTCLFSTIVPVFLDKKKGTELASASVNLQTLYQNQVLQYFSSKRFSYSLTRMTSWPDFVSARPPGGNAEKIVGLTKANVSDFKDSGYVYVPWTEVGFPLTQPSYYIYRIGPEPAFQSVAKPGRSHGNPYHFQVVAVGDLDNDGKPSVLLRNGYVDQNDVYHGSNIMFTADLLE